MFNAASRTFNLFGGVISSVLSGNTKIVGWSSLKGIVLNILLFIPFGYLLPEILPQKKWTWWKVALLGMTGSLVIEVIQLVTRLGFADIDDLMNNTIGALIGYLLYKKCLTHVVKHKGKKDTT